MSYQDFSSVNSCTILVTLSSFCLHFLGHSKLVLRSQVYACQFITEFCATTAIRDVASHSMFQNKVKFNLCAE